MKKIVFILCVVFVLCILLLVMPSAAANVTATVSPSTVAHGEKIFINGTAVNQPSSVAIWILGTNFAFRQTVAVNVDGSFSYEITQDTTNAMYSGQYFVVVQHPGMNGTYDIDICGSNPQFVCDYSGTIPVSVFRISGSGSLQGSDSADALVMAINQPYIDDTYAELQFQIKANITATVSPSIAAHGDKIFINGTAESQPISVAIWILGKNFVIRQTEPVNVDGSFSYVILQDTTNSMYNGQYFVVVQHPGMNGTYDIDLGADPQYVYDFSGTTPVSLFKITGPGSLQGFDAAKALEQGINQPGIDDSYTEIQFQIVSLSTTGVYRPGVGFYLKMDNGSIWTPSTDRYLAWDNAAIDRPIAGDWNSDGRTETGVYRPGVGFYLKMDNGSTWNPSTDRYLAWDNAAVDLPIAGDWNADGRTETGVYRPGVGFYLKMDNGSTWNPSTDVYLAWDNAAGDLPIAGDWNMDGRSETGVYRPGVGFYLKMDNSSNWNPSSDVYLAWDNAAIDRPVAGDWNADGRTETGVYRPGVGFYLKWDNGSTWNSSTDKYLAWDNAVMDLPIAGNFV